MVRRLRAEHHAPNVSSGPRSCVFLSRGRHVVNTTRQRSGSRDVLYGRRRLPGRLPALVQHRSRSRRARVVLASIRRRLVSSRRFPPSNQQGRRYRGGRRVCVSQGGGKARVAPSRMERTPLPTVLPTLRGAVLPTRASRTVLTPGTTEGDEVRVCFVTPLTSRPPRARYCAIHGLANKLSYSGGNNRAGLLPGGGRSAHS